MWDTIWSTMTSPAFLAANYQRYEFGCIPLFLEMHGIKILADEYK